MNNAHAIPPQNAEPDSATTLTQSVYERIRGDILLGVLRPGARLRLEALRDSYAASVNTLRESLSRLVSEGLVAAEGQRGFQVVEASLTDLRDIVFMRRLLEVEAARRAIATAGLDWEARLVAAYHKLSRIEDVVDSDPERYGPELEAFNRAFHATLVSGCGSRWLTTFHGVMYDQSLRYRMLAFSVSNFPRDLSRQEHRQILDAALARDGDALERVLTAHVTKGVDLYRDENLSGRTGNNA